MDVPASQIRHAGVENRPCIHTLFFYKGLEIVSLPCRSNPCYGSGFVDCGSTLGLKSWSGVLAQGFAAGPSEGLVVQAAQKLQPRARTTKHPQVPFEGGSTVANGGYFGDRPQGFNSG